MWIYLPKTRSRLDLSLAVLNSLEKHQLIKCRGFHTVFYRYIHISSQMLSFQASLNDICSAMQKYVKLNWFTYYLFDNINIALTIRFVKNNFLKQQFWIRNYFAKCYSCIIKIVWSKTNRKRKTINRSVFGLFL